MAGTIEPQKILGFVGSAILGVAVFMPILRIPIVGTISYVGNGRGDGIIVLILALLGLLFTARGSYKWLSLPGVGTLAILAFTFVSFQSAMDEAMAQLNRDLAGNPFRGIADAAVASVGLEWGFGMVGLGAIVLLAAVVVDGRR